MEDNAKKCLFVTFAFGGYEKFVPSFIYSIINQGCHDDAGVVVFMPDTKLSREVKSWVHKNISGNYNIFFEEIKCGSMALEDFQGGKVARSIACRWLTDLSVWHDYRYALILDVDILVLDDVSHIAKFHTSRMRKLGLPFSNILRHPRKERVFPGASKRLSGIHFVEIKPYFSNVNKTIKLFEEVPARMVEVVGESVVDDEVVLYSVCKKSFEFVDENLRAHDHERPWHGIHLGAFRGPKLSKKLLAIGTGDRQDFYLEMCKKFILDPIFINSIEAFPTMEKIFFFNSIISRKSYKFQALYLIFKMHYFVKKMVTRSLSWYKNVCK